MKVVITGVAGFIGSNLAERLIANGDEVVGFDDLSHGNMNNLTDVIESNNFSFFLRDITGPIVWEANSADAVVHLASEKIPRYSNSYNTITRNQDMIVSVVDLARRSGARLLFASTSDVYGKNENIPFSEESELVMGNTNVKRWSYAVSKIHSEHYIIASHDKYGLDYTIMRFFSCYGKHQAHGWWGGVQSAFMENTLLGNDIEIHGSGQQSRCFTYIDDAVDGIMLCLTRAEATNEIFNIGNPSSYCTIYGLSKRIFEITGKSVGINYIPYSDLGKYEDSKIKMPDITKARKLLGFEPRWNLLDGLKQTIEWQKKEHALY